MMRHQHSLEAELQLPEEECGMKSCGSFSALEPLLAQDEENKRRRTKEGPRKRGFCGFGYLPLWSEFVPLSGRDRLGGAPDWGGIGVNVLAGTIMGVREALGGIVSASMVFSSSDIPEISNMLQFGISMTLYTMSVGVLWYSVFGRLQYGYGTQQDLICILQAQLAVRAADQLAATPDKIPATVFAIICLSAVLTGLISIVVGKLALGTAMLMIPKPVVSGFLGAIGVVVLEAGLKTASGVKFHHFVPDTGWVEFFSSSDRVWQVACMLGHAICIRRGPALVHFCLRTHRHPGREEAVKKYAGLACQLLPAVFFYVAVGCLGVSMETLQEHGWTYPSSGNMGPLGLWTTYKIADVDVGTVWSLLFSEATVALVAMAILCTMLGALAITGRFSSGPDGDPAPDDPLDFNAELTTVGAASVVLGLTGGNLVFHKFSVIQLREDGGTHRIAVMTIALVSGSLFLFGFPIGSYVPKWFLGGLFLNTGWSFLRKTLLSYRSLAVFNWKGVRIVSPQYLISTCCVLVALSYSPTTAIIVGLILSIFLFVFDGMSTSPVSNVVDGKHVVSRTKRPWWEMQVLGKEGDRIRLLYLQGQLFFGSTLRLTSNLAAAAAYDRIQFMILSFARVPLVDPSATEILKTAQEKMRKRGCHMIFCRMNEQVFDTLSAAGVVRAPCKDFLNRAEKMGWSFLNSPSSKSQSLENPPDVFFHETDALDFCDEYIIDKYCYNRSNLALEPYMRQYGITTRIPGSRLPESTFEMMNDLPLGVMRKIRPFCEVREEEYPGTILSDVLPDMERALCFIVKGAISLVQMIPIVDDTYPLQLKSATFAFRAGKRLLARYPPGHVGGMSTFFKFHKQRVNPQLQPKLIVSSQYNPPAEIWVLRYERCKGIPGWKQMPDDLKGYLARMLCVQFADAMDHANLKER